MCVSFLNDENDFFHLKSCNEKIVRLFYSDWHSPLESSQILGGEVQEIIQCPKGRGKEGRLCLV